MSDVLNLTIGNVTQPLAEWALDYGIPCKLIRTRLAKGWNAERAVTEPTRHTHYRLTPADMKDVPLPAKTLQSKPIEFTKQFTTSCKASTRFIGVLAHDGRALTVLQWATHLGVDPQVIYYRIRKGYPLSIVLDGKRHTGKSRRPTIH